MAIIYDEPVAYDTSRYTYDGEIIGIVTLGAVSLLASRLSEIGLGVASLTTIASSQAKLDGIIFTV